MSASVPIIVSEILKNSKETIKVSLSMYAGHALADVRCYVPIMGMDVLGPTKKGISVRVEMLDEVIDALHLARAEAIKLGWLEGSA